MRHAAKVALALAVLAAALLSFAGAATAQVVQSDTVYIVIEGTLATVELDVLTQAPYRVGDTIQIVARTMDADGDQVSAVLTWQATDPSAVDIIPDPQGARIVPLRKLVNGVGIWVLAQQSDEVVTGWFLDGEDPSTMTFEMPVQLTAFQQTAVLCTYWLYRGYTVQQTGGCPFPFLPLPIDHRAELPIQPRLLRGEAARIASRNG